jgi:MFS family permease
MLGDSYPKKTLLSLNLIGTALALLALAFGNSIVSLLVYGALFGFSWGMRTAVVNSLMGDYFGRAAFGRIVGLASTVAFPLAIATPVLVGIGVDLLRGYRVPLLFSALWRSAHQPSSSSPTAQAHLHRVLSSTAILIGDHRWARGNEVIEPE